MYLALVFGILIQAWLPSPRARRLMQIAVAVIAGGGVAFSAYLTYLEGFVIHAWCAWCAASAIIVTLLFILALRDLGSSHGGTEKGLETEQSRFALRKRFVLVAILMVAGEGFAYHYLTGRPEVPNIPAASNQTLDQHLVHPDSHATGDLNSPVTVVEFGDFECPSCGASQPTVEQMLEHYGNRVRFVFRQFPLTEIHPYAETAAEASECAAEQGKFWEAERKFYQNQDDLTEPALVRYVGDIGLDTSRFQQCLIDGAAKARVVRDLEDGRAAGVQGTPTFFVGHQKFFGPPTLGQLDPMIDKELAASSTPRPAAGQAYAAPGSTPSAATSPAQSASSPSSATGSPSNPVSATQNPAAGPGSGSSGELFGSSGTSAFTSTTSNELACSPDELKKQQPTLIHTAEVQQLFQSDSKPVFIDVRPAGQFPAGHLPGAVNIPVDQIEGRAASLPKDRTIVLYESGKSGASSADVCAVSRAGARVLLAEHFDYAKVKVYQDGLTGWEKAGLPVEK
jgi:protein-disulfide isomerase/rhodanese-related sulfurtransferase